MSRVVVCQSSGEDNLSVFANGVSIGANYYTRTSIHIQQECLLAQCSAWVTTHNGNRNFIRIISSRQWSADIWQFQSVIVNGLRHTINLPCIGGIVNKSVHSCIQTLASKTTSTYNGISIDGHSRIVKNLNSIAYRISLTSVIWISDFSFQYIHSSITGNSQGWEQQSWIISTRDGDTIKTPSNRRSTIICTDTWQLSNNLIAVACQSCDIIHCNVAISRTVRNFHFSSIWSGDTSTRGEVRFYHILTNRKSFTRNRSCINNSICCCVVPNIGKRSLSSIAENIGTHQTIICAVTHQHTVQLSMNAVNLYIVCRGSEKLAWMWCAVNFHIIFDQQGIQSTQIIDSDIKTIRIQWVCSPTYHIISVHTELVVQVSQIVILNHRGQTYRLAWARMRRSHKHYPDDTVGQLVRCNRDKTRRRLKFSVSGWADAGWNPMT